MDAPLKPFPQLRRELDRGVDLLETRWRVNRERLEQERKS